MQGLRGGRLVTVLGSFGRHGDPVVSALVGRLLKPACAPILSFLRRWLSDGELDDPFAEFFIECNASMEDRRWAVRCLPHPPFNCGCSARRTSRY